MSSNRPSEPQVRACAQARKAAWPQGATAGLLLVAAACAGVSTALYHLVGPSDAFAQQ